MHLDLEENCLSYPWIDLREEPKRVKRTVPDRMTPTQDWAGKGPELFFDNL